MTIVVMFRLYLPIIISFILFVLLFFVKKEKGIKHVTVNPTIFGVSFFAIRVPLSTIWLVRAILFCSSVAALFSLLFVDYSSFFPANWSIKVFFDQPGICTSLKALSDDELKELGIPDNYEQFQQKYFDDVSIVLRKVLQKSNDTVFTKEDIHGEGRGTFIVQNRAGIQKYYIKECTGQFQHTLDKSKMTKLNFKSFYEKRDSRYDYLSPSLKDIFIRRAVIIQPRTKQAFSQSSMSNEQTFDHVLVCVTKVYFFPYPRLSNSIYMIDYEGIGLVPIGYGILTNVDF